MGQLVSSSEELVASKDEILDEETTNPFMRNWLCANLAFRETSKALAVFMHREVSRIHKNMQKSAGTLPLCQDNCSRRSDRENRPWCFTCDRWRSEIVTACEQHYKPQINWTRLNSAQWPVHPYEVARVFMPRAHRLYYKSAEFHEDYRFSLSFIENSSEINIPKLLCEKAWQYRGRVKRRNVRMRMKDKELENLVSAMIELLSHEAFGDNQNVIIKLQSLLRSPEEESKDCVIM